MWIVLLQLRLAIGPKYRFTCQIFKKVDDIFIDGHEIIKIDIFDEG